MGTFRKIVLTIVLVFSIFMLNIDGRYLFGWTEEEWDELEDWANENDIPYNEYSDADDFYADNGYDDEDDYWNSQGYDDADDFWETNDTEGEDDIGDTNTSDPLDAEAVKQEIYSDDATWYKNGDGSFSIDVDNDGMMDYLALVVGSYIYVNDINIEIEEISIIYEPDVSSPNIDQEDSADEDIVNDSESEENDDDDEPLPIICACCGEYGHSYCSACEEETVACNCEVCPDCGGCILEYGESLPEGCDFKCIHCTNSFDFSCITRIRPVTEVKTLETTLYSLAYIGFNIVLNVTSLDLIIKLVKGILGSEYVPGDGILVELKYKIGTLLEWSGDLQFICSNQIITSVLEESVGNEFTAAIGNIGMLTFYEITLLTGYRNKIYENYVSINEEYIDTNEIDRDGAPKIGENVYKEFHFEI
ncbi:hypothetical protein [Roseimarinus sediminis]|uniref:hypothetical protein n=1 Tax=Roseimarinus sediminis TaxID=1610899 RepID=UPI003D1F95BC